MQLVHSLFVCLYLFKAYIYLMTFNKCYVLNMKKCHDESRIDLNWLKCVKIIIINVLYMCILCMFRYCTEQKDQYLLIYLFINLFLHCIFSKETQNAHALLSFFLLCFLLLTTKIGFILIYFFLILFYCCLFYGFSKWGRLQHRFITCNHPKNTWTQPTQGRKLASFWNRASPANTVAIFV